MMDPRLSQGLAVLATATLVITSWRWGYAPAVRAYRQDQQQVKTLSAQLASIDATVQAAGGLEQWQAHHAQRLAALHSRFPPQSRLPQLLNALVDTVKAGDVRLLNISQGNVEAVQDAGQPVLVDGQPCYRLPVTVTAEGRYHALLQALDRITAETFPSIAGIGQAELKLNDPLGAQLAATLQLYLYVVGTSAEPAPDV